MSLQPTFWLHPSVEKHKELHNILEQHKAKIYKTLRSPALTYIITTPTAAKQNHHQQQQQKPEYQPYHILVTPEWVISTLSGKSAPANGVLSRGAEHKQQDQRQQSQQITPAKSATTKPATTKSATTTTSNKNHNNNNNNNNKKATTLSSPKKRPLKEDPSTATSVVTTTTTTRKKSNAPRTAVENVKVQLKKQKSTASSTPTPSPLQTATTPRPSPKKTRAKMHRVQDISDLDDSDLDDDSGTDEDVFFVDDGSVNERDFYENYDYEPDAYGNDSSFDYEDAVDKWNYYYHREDEEEDDEEEETDYILTKRLNSYAKPTKPTPQETKLVFNTKKGLGMIPHTNKVDHKMFHKIVNARNYHQPPKTLPQQWDGDKQLPTYDFTREYIEPEFWSGLRELEKPCPDDFHDQYLTKINLRGYYMILEQHEEYLTQQDLARSAFKESLVQRERPDPLSHHFEDPTDRVYCPSCNRWGRVSNHLGSRAGCHHCLCYCNACEQNFNVTKEGLEKRSSACHHV